MKRSVRKNKRQQQAAGCSMDKKHRNSEETYEKSVERQERQKMRRDRRRKKHENKYTARHQLLRLPILVLLAAAGMFAPKLLSSCPQQTERIYSRAIYPVISRVLGAASSIFPFSVAEVLIISVGTLLAVTLVVRLFKLVFSKLLKRKHNRMRFYSCLISLGMFAGAMLNLFYAFWGINHYRMPAASLLGFSDELERVNSAKSEFIAAAETGDDSASSDIYAEMLASTCERIAAAAAENRSRLRENENGVFIADDKNSENSALSAVLKSVQTAYAALGSQNELFGNPVFSAKSVHFSNMLSRLDISGIYIPYTAEANVNTEQPALLLFASAAHETAHYFGFAREDEANFIAYYVSGFSNDPALRYSCEMLALMQCMNRLASVDEKLFYSVRERFFTPAMIRDLADYSRWTEQYKNDPLGSANNKINDAYLKHNGQTAGVNSYNDVAELLIAFEMRK